MLIITAVEPIDEIGINKEGKTDKITNKIKLNIKNNKVSIEYIKIGNIKWAKNDSYIKLIRAGYKEVANRDVKLTLWVTRIKTKINVRLPEWRNRTIQEEKRETIAIVITFEIVSEEVKWKY